MRDLRWQHAGVRAILRIIALLCFYNIRLEQLRVRSVCSGMYVLEVLFIIGRATFAISP